jgi:hypothetical protein
MTTRSNGKSDRSGAGRNGGNRTSVSSVTIPDKNSPEPATVSSDLDAELAALLESEASGAETPSHAEFEPASTQPVRGAGGADEVPRPTVSSVPTASTGYLSILPDRPLPATKRFGAIILDAPFRSSGAELAAGLPDPRGTPPGPGKEGDEPGPLPAVVIRTEDQKSNVIKRLDTIRDAEWQRKFHAQIDRLYKQISEEFSTPPDIAQKMLEMLREARQLMIDSPEEFGNAEYRVMQVATSVERRRQSRQQARLLGPWLLLYLSAWLFAFTAALLFANQITDYVRVWGRITQPQLANLLPIFNTMIWGGIGGVVGGLYALWYHIADRQDFDKHYSMWYYVQPLMGMVLGAITFLIIAGGFLIVQVNITDPNAAAGARLIPYLVAVLAGFKQDFVYDQLERVVSIFAPGPAKPEASQTK